MDVSHLNLVSQKSAELLLFSEEFVYPCVLGVTPSLYPPSSYRMLINFPINQVSSLVYVFLIRYVSACHLESNDHHIT